MRRFGVFLGLALLTAPLWAQVGQVTLGWVPATTYTDGSPLTLARQDIYRGENGGPLLLLTSVGPGLAAYVDPALFNADYCYHVVSVDGAAVVSAPSNQACKSVAIPGNATPPPAGVIPNPPTALVAQ